MKRWLSLAAVAISMQACTAMDGEHTRMQKRSSSSGDRARGGTQADTKDPDPLDLQSGDAGTTAADTDVVECGNSACSGSTPFCCASIDTGTCVDAQTKVCPGDRFLMRCDDHTDCGADQVCCAWWDNTQTTLVWESACTAKSACTPAASADRQQARVWMCMSDADCPTGSTCSVEATNWNGTGINIKAAFCSIPGVMGL